MVTAAGFAQHVSMLIRPPTPQAAQRTMCGGLSLSAHVRACLHDGEVVMLDLRQNRYLGISSAKLAALAPAVRGWPQVPSSPHVHVPEADVDRLAAPLLKQGILTRGPGTAPCPSPLPIATRSLNADDLVASASVGVYRTLSFLRSSTAASLCLRLRSLHAIAGATSARRDRAQTRDAAPAVDALQQAVAAHMRLRPLLHATHYRCLHDALSLIGFLSSEGLFPHWVIGVATRPFRAHSWVQSGDLVLNDLHENVQRYTPILVA
ncbi:MAG: lasso peptide biosynthesis B2 protein [Rubrivivax sp.]|nr:lasso peptide biosynthesis B2 protein [Rubrivivax sp.]